MVKFLQLGTPLSFAPIHFPPWNAARLKNGHMARAAPRGTATHPVWTNLTSVVISHTRQRLWSFGERKTPNQL